MSEPTNYICDLCGFQDQDLQTVMVHLHDAHGIQDPAILGSVQQDGASLTLTNGDETVIIDLDAWIREMVER